ncbi:hypothetical protein F5882DRAFT_73304 [Hyaloscypha sp. PMI_1271]|nr:hypothetical protein F5882DRAFT_73304 [Hyaloscypha sp. PMI_1271]
MTFSFDCYHRLLIPALLLSKIPQYFRFRLILHGPCIVSPWYITMLVLFNAIQVLSRIYSPQINTCLLLLRNDRQCSFWIYSSLLEYILTATQWLCTFFPVCWPFSLPDLTSLMDSKSV